MIVKVEFTPIEGCDELVPRVFFFFKLIGVCRPWYGTVYPIEGQILDKIIPYNIGQIFKIGPRSDIIFSKNANFYSKMKNVARRHFCPKSPISFSSENRIIFKLSYPIVGQNNQRQTLL